MDKQKNVICRVFYRQHENPESFLENLANTLENLSLQNKNIVLMGDFNIDLLKIESCSYSQALITPYLDYGICAWAAACKSHLNKLLVLQKRALRLIYFKQIRDHVVPLFIDSTRNVHYV